MTAGDLLGLGAIGVGYLALVAHTCWWAGTDRRRARGDALRGRR